MLLYLHGNIQMNYVYNVLTLWFLNISTNLPMSIVFLFGDGIGITEQSKFLGESVFLLPFIIILGFLWVGLLFVFNLHNLSIFVYTEVLSNYTEWTLFISLSFEIINSRFVASLQMSLLKSNTRISLFIAVFGRSGILTKGWLYFEYTPNFHFLIYIYIF